jgi:hypothetical protein
MKSFNFQQLCEELIRLTNIFYGVNDNSSIPLFLIDNAHRLANCLIPSLSSNTKPYTILNSILNDMSSYR